MRVFCSQCGTPNEGQPGTKVMCTNCTAVFDVPAQDPGLASTVISAPSAGQPTPPPQPAATPSPFSPEPAPPSPQAPSWGAPQVNPGLPGPHYPAPPAAPGQSTEVLAIVSLVLGILCCIPFGSIAAIITGALAVQKINANPQLGGKGLAVAGMVLGGIAVLFSMTWVLIALVGNH